MTKKTFSFGHCPYEGGGGLPMPEFLALFQEVHFCDEDRVGNSLLQIWKLRFR